MSARIVLLLKQETISYGVEFDQRYARHACVECVNKLDINEFDFTLGWVIWLNGSLVFIISQTHLTNPFEINYQMEYQFTIPRVIRIERDQLELEQFVYTLTEYNNFREGEFC